MRMRETRAGTMAAMAREAVRSKPKETIADEVAAARSNAPTSKLAPETSQTVKLPAKKLLRRPGAHHKLHRPKPWLLVLNSAVMMKTRKRISMVMGCQSKTWETTEALRPRPRTLRKPSWTRGMSSPRRPWNRRLAGKERGTLARRGRKLREHKVPGAVAGLVA
jgi:hypothetical protein